MAVKDTLPNHETSNNSSRKHYTNTSSSSVTSRDTIQRYSTLQMTALNDKIPDLNLSSNSSNSILNNYTNISIINNSYSSSRGTIIREVTNNGLVI